MDKLTPLELYNAQKGIEELSEDVYQLRKFLWLNHGHMECL